MNRILGILCEFFCIKSKRHLRYIWGYKTAKNYSNDRLRKIIFECSIAMPSVDPYKTNAIMQLRGMRDQLSERS